CSRRSDSVVLPWSMWAMIEKLRMNCGSGISVNAKCRMQNAELEAEPVLHSAFCILHSSNPPARDRPPRCARRRGGCAPIRNSDRRRSQGGLAQELLDDHGVAPLAVELRVALVRADLAEAEGA